MKLNSARTPTTDTPGAIDRVPIGRWVPQVAVSYAPAGARLVVAPNGRRR